MSRANLPLDLEMFSLLGPIQYMSGGGDFVVLSSSSSSAELAELAVGRCTSTTLQVNKMPASSFFICVPCGAMVRRWPIVSAAHG